MELWDYERQAWNSGAETVCGVDEAGAGPLMGRWIVPTTTASRW